MSSPNPSGNADSDCEQARQQACEQACEQAGVIALLSRPGVFAPPSARVERYDTHGAHVFLAGDLAIKIKRAVRFAYLDFSTPAKRRSALERELELNRGNAPEIYLDVVAITEQRDGGLAIGGDGDAIEWCLRMRRFDQSALFSQIVAQGIADDALKALADEVLRSHLAAPVADAAAPAGWRTIDGPMKIVLEVAEALARDEAAAGKAAQFKDRALEFVTTHAALLERRAQTGKVRRCHGDLHLDNIVMWNGQPTLFDALEFDEALATVDTLYDLAFLLMDLDIRASRTAANRLLNRYLWRGQDAADLEGLRLLPLFLSLRAGVRAMVSLQRSHLVGGQAQTAATQDGRRYLDAALAYANPPGARLVATGGFSGTGKSTLAAALAPRLGAAPGALHLRSDLERKAMHRVDELVRLDDAAYSRAESARVYDVVGAKARLALSAGHAVIVDAVFAGPDERAAIEGVARGAGVPFCGLWLEARPDVMRQRVTHRTGDASDASSDVVDRQIRQGAGAIGWTIVDASNSAAETLSAAAAVLPA